MRVIITDWALQSYFDLLRTFSSTNYKEVLRPDAELLKSYPRHPKFGNSKFWGPCKDRSKRIVSHGYKMKWHNFGYGKVQLRLLVVILEEHAYLCNAYVKDSSKKDEREMEKLKVKIKLIQKGGFVSRGRLI
jgi:hypothetical protein